MPSTDFQAEGMDGAGPSLQRETSNKQTEPTLLESQEKESGPSLLGRNGHEQTTQSIGNGEPAEESDQSSTMLVVDMKKQPGRAKRKEVGEGNKHDKCCIGKGGLALRCCHGTSRWHPSVPHINLLSLVVILQMKT